jgi:hypothetical protein
MSSANRITQLEKIVEQVAIQLSREVGGMEQAIKFLAVGLDDVANRMDKFEAAARAAVEAKNGGE